MELPKGHTISGGWTRSAEDRTLRASGLLQRKCACGQHKAGGGECEECRKKRQGTLQRSALGRAEGEAPLAVHAALRSPGQPLDPYVRSALEPRFGHDFSHVRVHTGSLAAESARSVDAEAYTVGRDIVFAGGRYAPDRTEGLGLVAHELTHVLQQGAMSTSHPLRIGPADDAFERQADRMAAAVLAPQPGPGAQPSVRGGAAGLQRQAAGGRAPQADLEGCDPTVSASVRSSLQPARDHVDRAIAALAPGWDRMAPAHQALFRQFFDPAGSGDIDASFVRDVRDRFHTIRNAMAHLSFVCNRSVSTICGSSSGWCTGGRLMWTCLGTIYLCPAFATETDPQRKIQNIIHETVHNALWTTDREYASSPDFSRLRPRGSGILSFLSQIPVLGFLFRLIRSNNDTLYNPDSYAEFAMGL